MATGRLRSGTTSTRVGKRYDDCESQVCTGDAIPYDDTYVHKSVENGDNVWFGINVTVIPGVTIEEGAIIQSGSVVTTEIPSGAIAGSHPAEVFDHRDMDHYVKSEGKFY